jgi:hypothetical protein
MSHATPLASVGIAGVNTHPLHAATLGIAGNWGSTLGPHLEHITAHSPLAMSARLGDLAASACWTRACYLLDYTHLLLVTCNCVLIPRLSMRVSVTYGSDAGCRRLAARARVDV